LRSIPQIDFQNQIFTTNSQEEIALEIIEIDSVPVVLVPDRETRQKGAVKVTDTSNRQKKFDFRILWRKVIFNIKNFAKGIHNVIATQKLQENDRDILVLLFYIEWRFLMTLILEDATKLSASSIYIKDALNQISCIFQWRSNLSTTYSFFPDQTVPSIFNSKFRAFYDKYISTQSPLAVKISTTIYSNITNVFESNEIHQKINLGRNTHNNPPELHNSIDSSSTVVPFNVESAFESEYNNVVNPDIISVARIPKRKPLMISVFSEAKDEVLKAMFDTMFLRFLESEEGIKIRTKFKNEKLKSQFLNSI
ncbi:hypothetical protein HK096_002169, partial [Nowakowskiella sp. JEL0078]